MQLNNIVPRGFSQVSDEEFNTYGYVAEVYRRDDPLGGSESTLGTTTGTTTGTMLVIPHPNVPPKKTLIGEIITTNYYYEPISQGDTERVHISRILLSSPLAEPLVATLTEPLVAPSPGTFVLPYPLRFGEGTEESGVMIGNVEILANIFERVLLVPDIDDVGDIAEFVNLHFMGCPSIEMAIDEMGTALIVDRKGVMEALSVLFGRSAFLNH